MTDEILVSYILPCYNTGLYIKQCIESLYRQGLDENKFEVIFVNNATEDNSEEIVFEIRKQYTNFIYIKLEENICAGGAYNTGLKVARGRYVQFVDSDDYLKDNYMLDIVTQMEQENLDVLYFNIDSFKDFSELTHEEHLPYNGNFTRTFRVKGGNEYYKAAMTDMSISILPVPAYRKMIRKSVLIEHDILFTPTTVGCDYLHNLQLLSYVSGVKVITDKVYMFRYNPHGVTKSRFTSSAITYALNNYDKAYKEVSRTPFELNVKEQIISNLSLLIDAYVGAMKYLSFKERKAVIDGLSDTRLFKIIPRGFINKMLSRHGVVSRYLFKPTLFYKLLTLRRFIKKWRF